MIHSLITTLGRVHNQITYHNLKAAGLPCTIVVQQHEYEAHKEAYPEADVFGLPPEILNIGPTRCFLMDNWQQFSDSPRIILFDDDVEFYWREDPADWHLTTPGPEQMHQMFTEIDEALKVYAHVGVSGREGNNRVKEYHVYNTRFMRLLGYNMEKIGTEIRPEIDHMSDFDMNLRLLRAGHESLVFYRWAQGHRSTQSPGGCSINRTHDTHSAEIDKMLEYHAGFVKDRWKKNKTGGEFGQRRELTIQWKKAYESSRKGAKS